MPLCCSRYGACTLGSHLLFDLYGGTACRWGEEAFLVERTSVFSLVN